MSDAPMRDKLDEGTRPPDDQERAQQQRDPDTLYDLGMAYYRRRHWRQAKASFEQLHALQPTRRGVEALLRELDIFIQLESVEEAGENWGQAGSEINSAGSEASRVDVQRSEGAQSATPAQKHRWWLAPLILVVAAVIVGAVWFVVSGPLSPQESETGLRNQMQSYLVAQRYCTALEVATKLIAMVPGDLEALNAIDKSKTRLYAEATDYSKINDTEHAMADLECIYRFDPAYKDVSALMDSLRLRGELADLYRQAREDYMGTGAYGEAIKLLLQIRTLDATYRPGTISDDLYEAYLGEARQWLDLVRDELQPVGGASVLVDASSNQPHFDIQEDTLVKVREASKAYDRALGERPNDAPALQAKALAEALYDGLQRYINWTWPECVAKLADIFRQDPTFLSGKLAAVLCDANWRLADAYFQKQEYLDALAVYRTMAEIQACDPQLVQTLAYQAALPLTPTATPTETPAPTVTSTATPQENTPTRVPTPRPTRAVTPTGLPTVAPTSIAPQPTQPQPTQPQPTQPPPTQAPTNTPAPTNTLPPEPTATLKPRN